MKFMSRALGGLVLTGLTLAALVWAGWIIRDAVVARGAEVARMPEARERVFAVRVVTAEEADIAPVLEVFGEVSSRRSLELRMAAGGQVVWISENFENGGRVGRGDLLVRIDPADALAARDRARADLTDAEAEQQNASAALALAEDELRAARAQADLRAGALTRQRDLAGRGVGSTAAVEQAELALSNAETTVLARRQAVANAQARLAQAATRIARSEIALSDAERVLADTELTARFDGALAEVTIREGSVVTPNERLGRLVDPDALDISIRLSTAQYARLLDEAGQLRPLPLTATLETGGMALVAEGVIARESAQVSAGQTGRQLFAQLDQPGGLKPGDFVTVRISEPPLARIIALPATALGPDSTVLVLDEDSRLMPLPVTLLRRQGDAVLVRAEGLAGRQVVAERTPLLGLGIKVRPVGGDANMGADPSEVMVPLSEAERARLKALVEGNGTLPDAARARMIAALDAPEIPARMLARINGQGG